MINELNTGIYEIKNTITGKRYIGSAAKTFKKRWNLHKWQLKKNNHHNSHLQNSWNKYGADNFEFKILEYVAPEFCTQRETWWIQLFGTDTIELGYNLTSSGESILGFKHSQSTIEHLREINTGEKNPMWGKTLSDERKQEIRAFFKGNTHTKGMLHTESTKQKMSLSHKEKLKSEEHKSKIKESNCKYQYTITKPDKTQEITISLSEFCRNYNLDHRAMYAVVNGRQKQHKGYNVTKTPRQQGI